MMVDKDELRDRTNAWHELWCKLGFHVWCDQGMRSIENGERCETRACVWCWKYQFLRQRYFNTRSAWYDFGWLHGKEDR